MSAWPANKEYYHQWSVEECHGCSLDLSAFTIEELDNITSEYTLKNTVGSETSFQTAASFDPSILTPVNPPVSLLSGHFLHSRVLPVWKGGVRVPAGLLPPALQARVSPGNCVF